VKFAANAKRKPPAAPAKFGCMQPKAVIFDFGGVLCFPPTPEQIASAAALCGLTPEAFWDAFWHKRREYDRGHEASAYWHDIASNLGQKFDDAMVAEMIRREVDFWSNYDQRVLAWAGQLRRNGMRTSILSNLPRPLGEVLRATPGFLDVFDQVTFSYELGVIKPEAAIYQHAIRELGVQPCETLFLDDRADNVEGARAAGLQAELFTTWYDFLATQLSRYRLPAPR
jgi:putative hydrolase of the HAD superfamily